MQTREEILDEVRRMLADLFEIEPARVTLEANLYQDLEIDSIDAIDLMDQVRRHTHRKIRAEDFRAVRTVNDLVEAVYRLLNE